ncbi:AmmeMemoRadiSam system radical SAM enzyme [candidate division WOR-3 bacterium]|nr:AmmeMemoRadiSam system radical SAM enzyme [candidate division WOR-3 bacterium]
MKVEAKYYTAQDNHVECQMCPHYCKILPGKYGLCRGRMNEDGRLWALNYGETTSIAMDPIEKKPLYHFHPGAQILSIACNSCNMRCPFCQNWEISQGQTNTQYIAPEILVRMLKDHNSLGVAYTYTEPLMWFEYILDAGAAVREAGGKNVLVTNGLINEAPLADILPLIDAMNIDLKTMDPEVYQKTLKGDLAAVKRTIETAHKKCHIEITNLIVTGLNDRKDDIDRVIDYIASVDPSIPLHFSRYYPSYEYTKPPTSVKTIAYAYEKAREKLAFVYIGNVPAEDGSHTVCPKCRNLLIERMYFKAMIKGLDGNKCNKCGERIPVVI